MTPEQKIIAIAEWEGWEFIKWGKGSLKIFHPSKSINDVIAIPLNGRNLDEAKIDYILALPPYLTSRDAICGAVARLSDAEFAMWIEHLKDILHCGSWEFDCLTIEEKRTMFLATPAQLADALLLTLGHEI